jgi:hypothetical protein
MATKQTPVRVNDIARLDEGTKASDLVEIAKQSGDFSKHYGKLWGGLIHLSHVNAAVGRRPFLWGGLITLGTVVGSLVLKYGWPILFG